MAGKAHERLDDVRSLRKALGRSQSQMAELLGVSVRAVQSYEQGWRPTPDYVQKLGGLFVMLARRQEKGKLEPCWKIKDCDRKKRAKCRAFQFRAGDLCWLVTGLNFQLKPQKSWEQKLAHCSKCPVMKQWLDC